MKKPLSRQHSYGEGCIGTRARRRRRTILTWSGPAPPAEKVDPSFRIRDTQKYTAVNKDRFEVDVIRREQADDDPQPIRPSDNEEDFRAAQALRAHELLHSPAFSAVIVASNGTMARMNTLAPSTFVRFKHWMSRLPDRDPKKKRRDGLQASAVEHVMREYLPQVDSNAPPGPQ
jgi:hypothetical protein